ncbi:MAG: radical SAM/SPASM domain-containing protein [Pseudomonadota bacterium]
MFDINFYMKIYDLKYDLLCGKKYEMNFLTSEFEKFRSEKPYVYNIETTNACNMKCKMCPRTTMMKRNVETMSLDIFKKIALQLDPFSDSDWEKWESFVLQKYKIDPHEMSENHFFLYIIPKVIVMHGYGDPLLDKDLPEKIRILNERGIITYFSCNPANINIDKTIQQFENGLNYIKYSIESTDDFIHREIRGKASDFTESYKRILKLIELKEKKNLKTNIVITMLNLDNQNQLEAFGKLKDAFADYDVYIYLKSQDQKWYLKGQKETNSIHWIEFCQFPWTSMTIKSNGEAVECVEDYNNEIILGDAKNESLYAIWNGEKYKQFRMDHFNLKPGIKCSQMCDMNLIGEFII